MDFENWVGDLFSNNTFSIIAAFVVSFMISYIAIPRIIDLAKSKNLYDVPNGRTSHSVKTPSLGGIAIYASFIIASLLFVTGKKEFPIHYLTTSVTIILFLGIKDDILSITPWKKLLGQISAALILIILGGIRFKNLNGFQDIYEIPYWFSVLLSLFVYIVVINCFNLVDGVDGLASGLAILSSSVLAVWFFINEKYDCLTISVILLGALIPFFIFNVFGKSKKLFMGDTGALIIGIISVVLITKFNQHNVTNHLSLRIASAPAVSIAIFFIPLYDTLQVFIRRIIKGKSPFNPDKNHLHHQLLKLNLSHIQVSIILISFNALVIVISYFLQFLGILSLSLILLFIGIVFSLTLDYLINTRKLQEGVTKTN